MSRRTLVASALVVQALVVLAVMADAPFAVRLPVSLLYVFAVPGFAAVGLLRLPEPVTEVSLSMVLSVVVTIATAQLLIWSGTYSLGAALTVLGTLTTLGLLAQLYVLDPDTADEEAEEAEEPAERPPPPRPRPRPQTPSWAHPHIRPRNDWR